MTARFADHKSLAFAYTDLVQAGFAEGAMRADFGTPPDENTVAPEHVGLLERLHRLAARMRAHAASPRHTPHHAEPVGADLTFEADERADEAAEIVARHGGLLVV